ncbi:MAG: hypothetical protein ACRCXZ_09910, partial [Patescibacteria group bacterium]
IDQAILDRVTQAWVDAYAVVPTDSKGMLIHPLEGVTVLLERDEEVFKDRLLAHLKTQSVYSVSMKEVGKKLKIHMFTDKGAYTLFLNKDSQRD